MKNVLIQGKTEKKIKELINILLDKKPPNFRTY